MTPKNKIVLISSYCDTEKKLDVLDKNIRTLKNLGLDVMLNSPIDLPNEITSLCDFYIRTKENPILTWPGKSVYMWVDYITTGKRMRFTRNLPDFGWANIHQVKKLSEYALTYDYEYFYHIIYDIKIDDFVLRELMSDSKCSFHRFHKHPVSLHFMLFNRENLSKFISRIDQDEYIDFNGFAESWLHNFIETSDLDYVIGDYPVEDLILLHGDIELFNYSEFNDFKFFISKNNKGLKNIEIHFYGFIDPINVTFHIDELEKKYLIGDRDVIDLGFRAEDLDQIESIKIQYGNVIFDITDKINNIVYNNIEIHEEN